MESCGGQFTELSGRNDITPHLNRLAGEGIYFTNCYANSWRTDRGTLCTYSGYPSFPTISVMKLPVKSRSLPCLARSLRDTKGYSTHYIYGGDINFTNMRSYLIGGGFEQLTWKADYSAADQKTAEWGVRDDITFGTLFDMATSMQSPYLIGYSTLSSHEPWDVPIHKFDDVVLNAFYYLDQCIGDFIAKLKKSKAWDNTLVILLPDHGINYKEYDELHPLRNHIPMLWVGGAVKAPRRIETICNQTDLPATLLGQLGVPHADYTFSRDVLSSSYTHPLAMHTYTEGFSIVDSTGFTVFDLNSQKTVKGNGNINLGKAILQAASKDLSSR
jgi:phosphoglycerol transferase MdoB-like AlkP superfamily enzyme